MRAFIPAMILGYTALTGAAVAESAYTKLDTDACEVLKTYEGGGIDLLCEGYEGIDVYVRDGDARMEADYGVSNDAFETFSAFNSVGETIEWMLDAEGTPYATALRFHIDVDDRSAEALVVSRIGNDEQTGCVIGVVDATADHANGVARGIGAMASLFDCATDQVVIVPGAAPLVAEFSGANR